MYDLCNDCKKCGETTCGNDFDCLCFEPIELDEKQFEEDNNNVKV